MNSKRSFLFLVYLILSKEYLNLYLKTNIMKTGLKMQIRQLKIGLQDFSLGAKRMESNTLN